MSNLLRKQVKSSTIRENFKRDFKRESNKLFLRNLILLIASLILAIYLLLPKNLNKKVSNNTNLLQSVLNNIDTLKDASIIAQKNNSKTIQSYASNPDEVFGNFKTSFENQKILILSQIQQQNDTLFNFQNFKIEKINNVIITTLNVQLGVNGYVGFRVVINPLGYAKESLNNTLLKNKGAQLLNSQTLEGYEYHLIALK